MSFAEFEGFIKGQALLALQMKALKLKKHRKYSDCIIMHGRHQNPVQPSIASSEAWAFILLICLSDTASNFLYSHLATQTLQYVWKCDPFWFAPQWGGAGINSLGRKMSKGAEPDGSKELTYSLEVRYLLVSLHEVLQTPSEFLKALG